MAGLMSNLTAGILGDPKKAMLIVRPIVQQDASLAGSLLSAAKGMLEGATGIDLPSIGDDQISMVVQYNPSSLSMQSTAQTTKFKRMLNAVSEGIVPQDTRAPSTILTVTLNFDDMNPKDAFMSEKFRVPTSFGEGVEVGSSLIRALTGNPYSVQKQTNGLVTLPLNNRTKEVTFVWANMSFTGIVQQAQARYTMFSVSGRPIRSEVTLSIMNEISKNEVSTYWNKAFDKCFKTTLNGSGGEKSVGASLGNVLNISGF